MNLDQLHSKIEAYLRNKMPTAERSQFEQDIKQNPEWKEELLLHALSHEAIDQMVEDEARQKLDKIRAKAKKKPPELVSAAEPVPTPVIPLWQRPIVKWGMAASIIGVIAIIAIQSGVFSASASSTIMAEDVMQLEREIFSNNTLGGGTTDPWADCLEQYDDEQYSQAITCLETHDLNNLDVQQYLAHAHFRLEQFATAGQQFKQILDRPDLSPNTDVQTRVEWNWMLCLAMQNDEQLRNLLDSVIQLPNYRYYDEALKLQELLGE